MYTENEIKDNIKENYGLENPISQNHTKYGYVVFDKHRKKHMDRITDYFNKQNVLLHGRFAEWKYPNMDTCIHNSMTLASKIDQMMKGEKFGQY